ncbi:MAG: efflux RND transporter periplasmic adaptor subunit [Betaproteobacteria bacterium]|nr:efflux RND transporter periplasmic adaptor subunit [Betaproteobacteria bacterium]MCL2886269.1 efflux RND transporter periplasmic adaptor subunit [Betaproteobacteria bacterium]
MRRTALIALAAALLAVVLFWSTRPQPIAVALQEVTPGRVEATLTNTRAGSIEACLHTKLSPIMGGRIDYLGVKEGDTVKKGQLLLKLWNDDQQANTALAEAQVVVAAKRTDEVCIAAANAEREARRQAELRARGFVSSSAEENARTDAEVRHAACHTARADVAQAEARLKATRTEQGRVALYAPFDGIVAKIVGELGEYSTPSPPGVMTPPAIELFDASCLYVTAPMDEVDAPKIAVGQTARISLDALPGQHFTGVVRRVAPYVLAVEKQARTVDVELDFADPAALGRLLVGYSTDVEIILESRDNVLRIPTAAIREGGRVLVYDAASGTLAERTIRTGLANWEYSEVLEGLSAGERIATAQEKDGIKAGARVRPAEEPAK